MKTRILAINLGSTSTKIAVYENDNLYLEKVFRHDADEILQFENSIAQKKYRKDHILNFVKENNYSLASIDIFVGRGGLIKPVEGGTYLVNEKMIQDLTSMKYGDHVCNLGAILAYEFAQEYNKVAYTVNPVVIDELSDLARISGFKGIERKSVFHALNQKAIAKRYAKDVKKSYEELNLIVVHMGGGISLGLHQKGRVVDVNDALGGEGPFSPERAGTLPLFSVIDLCCKGEYQTKQKLKQSLVRKGGLYSYLNTSSGVEISRRIEQGDKEAKLYFEAMAYQIIKNIGALYFAAKGEVDAIIFTGGLSYQSLLIEMLKEKLFKGLNVAVYPGEDELSALALGVVSILKKEEKVKHYK